jgi:hypothetical protein
MENLCKHILPTASAICGVKPEHSRLKPYGNLSHHADLICELVTSLLIRGIQMGEMSKSGWLIGLVKHAAWPIHFISYTCRLPSVSLSIHCSQSSYYESSFVTALSRPIKSWDTNCRTDKSGVTAAEHFLLWNVESLQANLSHSLVSC